MLFLQVFVLLCITVNYFPKHAFTDSQKAVCYYMKINLQQIEMY